MKGIHESPVWLRYAIPIVAVTLTVPMRMLLSDVTQGHPLILFLFPVIIAVWYGGSRPGALALLLSCTVSLFPLSPDHIHISSWDGLIRLGLFTLVSSFCILAIHQLYKSRYRAELNQHMLEKEIVDRKKIENDLRREVATRAKVETALVEALEHAEKASSAKSDFLANMSHEIRTPMNAVVGLSSVLALTTPLTPKQAECIATLKLSADSLMALINDMLDLSKIEARSMDLESIPLNLRHITEDVMEIMALRAEEKKLDFVIESYDLHYTDYIGDPTRIRQIMMNLCSNAIKFTERGRISVTLSSANSLADDVKEVTIRIRDTGPGVPPEKIGTIFEKFIQGDASINRKYGGSGLGLSITKSLSEAMGGSIAVESTVGIGSTFIVTLPLRLATNQIVAPSIGVTIDTYINTIHSSGKKVLLVEDNSANILVATSFLEQFGFEFDTVTDGSQALKKLESPDYFAVLMDVRMPGLDGLETTKLLRQSELRAKRRRISVIGMTAHAMANDKERCLAAGMDDYIAKPFDPERLEEKLKSLYEIYNNIDLSRSLEGPPQAIGA